MSAQPSVEGVTATPYLRVASSHSAEAAGSLLHRRNGAQLLIHETHVAKIKTQELESGKT